MNRQILRSIVKGTYDLQKLRIQTGNRVVASYKIKLGQKPSMSEAELDNDSKKYLEDVRKHFKIITEGMMILPPPKKFKPDTLIDDYTELHLISQYTNLYENEKIGFKRFEPILENFPIYTEYLKGVSGVGPVMAAVIISELNPHAAKYPSSFHMYSGLDTVTFENSKGEIVTEGRSKQASHLIDREYTDFEGNLKIKKSITFNPFLKSKLIGVLGPSFLKRPLDDCKYRKIYNDYKFRLQNHKKHKDKSKAHVHNMAIRYMIKMFLIDLHMAWRALEGLEVSKPYHEAKLGYKHTT